ncbi:hypothetical protein [Oceanobacillus iheyensis HTE831]|uniref:Uncharacterized protein n=1 Tax=Oceanobacillus iheyensis (strain DSM 14371 / CIP 107618 / JCM 11309 / KCTC 3954 / HTE831) TaxID=221109 RepID=Q8EMA3_OCEIH|nr:hypothetical protein [Oceanobacillus iheyensis]BAC14910.1 hypothetical protein [Oceanobacillus iheyensis HTE831]
MKQYTLTEKFFSNKGIHLVDENEKIIGEVTGIRKEGYERKNVFNFKPVEGSSTIVGIKKRSWKNVIQPSYGVIHAEHTYTLKDKLGDNLLYFCVTGVIENDDIFIEENWKEDIIVKVNKQKVAVIRPAKFSGKSVFKIDEQISPDHRLFGLIILMVFMYQIYNKEAAVIMDLLF